MTNFILCWIAAGLWLIASEINEMWEPNGFKLWSYKIPAMAFMVQSFILCWNR